MNLVNLATIGASIIGLFSVILAVFQYIKSSKLKRAKIFNSIIETLRTDPVILYWILIFDYGKDWYDSSFHNSVEKQAGVDKTLQTLSYICYLRENNLISDKEFSSVKYEIWRVLNDEGVQDYLFNLYHFSSRFFQRKHPKDVKDFPFSFLLAYGISENLIDDSFFDKDSRNKKFLNF